MKHFYRLFYPPAWSISTKISLALVSAAIAPMCFTSYYNLQLNLKNVEANEYRKLELLAVSNAGRLDQLLLDIQSVVIQVSAEPSVINFLASTSAKKRKTLHTSLQPTLNNVFHSNSDYDAVYLLDKQGNCLASTDPTFIHQNYAFREYFQQAIRGSLYISGILIGKTTRRPGLYLSSPVRKSDGEIIGVAVLKIKGGKIWAIINNMHNDQANYKRYTFLIDRQGIIISQHHEPLQYHSLNFFQPFIFNQIISDKFSSLNPTDSEEIRQLASEIVNFQETGHIKYYSSVHKTSKIVGFAPLHVQPWILGIIAPNDEFLVPLNRLIWQNTFSVLAVGAITAVIALIIARSITKPICILTSAAQALERGDLDSKLLDKVSRSHDDIGQLVRTFIHMAEQVKAREEKLKQQLMELHIEIDEAKKARHVAEIISTEYFQQLCKKAQKIRNRTVSKSENETDYFQHLHQKVQNLKKTNINDR